MTVTDQLVYSPYDYAIHEDPYPTYARLRAEAPLYRNEQLGFWALSRHADVSAAYKDTERFSSAMGVSLEPTATGPHASKTMSFLAMDPPKHGRMRGIVSRAFTPRRVNDLEPHILELTRAHLEPALERGEFDFVADFAGKLPMDVMSEMLGVPQADRAEVRRLADLLVHREEGVFDVPRSGMEAAMVLATYFGEMIAERRAQPRDDLTSALLEAQMEGERLSDGDVMAVLFLMIVAGNETTAKLLANALFWAAENPAEQTRAFSDGGWIDAWIEETLRYDGSSQATARTLTRDVELYEKVLAAGDRVLLLIGSANRDDSVFPDADRYDLARDTSDMVSFGAARHFCLGAPLARLEARVALTEIVRRIKSYEVDGARARRVHSVNVRGFASLPMTVEVR
jgi:cytochrome P450